ncbi:MAG: hypothetical protein ACLQVD_22650 [Capsulimonadaceae bacterium]
MYRKWSKEAIALEILSMYESGENLNYSNVADTNVTLLRAATRYFGTWEAAVNFAGLDYSQIRRYKSWTRDRIVSRIRELHSQGVDLSWRNISMTVDPQLAAAATKKNHFGSWREALEAAGLDYDTIRRYREWDDARILRMVRELHERGTGLNAKNMEMEDITLITAARRRFDSWHQALIAAGLDYRTIVQREPFKRGRGRGQYKQSRLG